LLTQPDITMLVIEALERLGVPCMVVGSLSAAAYGLQRTTQDADMVAGVRRGDGPRLASELGADFYIDAEAADEAIARGSSFSVIYLPAVFKVDIFALPARSYGQEAFARRRRMPFAIDPSRSAFVQSPEDVILSKLRWYRQGGEVSDQQWRDVLGVLKLQAGRLDMEYLRRWAAEEKVLDLLQRAVQQAS
jgi:hypothetical protein